MQSEQPYTEEEKEIADHLKAAWNTFVNMEKTHPSHVKDFADGIHKCQDILMHRICQRDYPEEFPTYSA